jgi:hypothetical protein
MVTELTPLQRMWLYENQLTRGGYSSEEDITKWGKHQNQQNASYRYYPNTTIDTTIFRSREGSREGGRIKRKNHDSQEDLRKRHRGKGPRFPHYGDKLPWQQSCENLKVYRDHYGVRQTSASSTLLYTLTCIHLLVCAYIISLSHTLCSFSFV